MALAQLDGSVPAHEEVRASVLAGTNIFGEPSRVRFRRELLVREGGWDNRFPHLKDQATYVRIMRHGNMIALRKPLASFRVSAGQWSVRLLGQQAAQSIACHRVLQHRFPDLLPAWEVLIGNSRAPRWHWRDGWHISGCVSG